MKIDSFKFFTSLICFSIACLNVQAAEQDNWYLAKEWQVDDRVNGMFWDYNETSQAGLLFCATENGVRAFDLDGTLVHSFGSGRYYDVVVDADGVVYATHYYGVTAFSKGPGRVTSVSVEHPGSRYSRSTDGEYPEPYWHHDQNGHSYMSVYLDFNGTGNGAKAYVLMEKNESLSGDYNWYPQNVVIEDGGSGYTGEVNASIRTFSGFSYKQIQFHSDAPVYDPSVDYAEGDVVRGHYSTSYSAYNFLYEFTANDISRINNDWNESSSYVEGDIVRILDGGSAAWYRRTNVVDEIDPDYNENPSVSSTQWEGIGLDNIDSLAQTGYFDLVDVTQSLGYDHAEFTVTVGNGYSQSWNLDGMNSVSDDYGRDISLQPQSGKLLVTDRHNVRFLDRNGTLLDEQFGSSGDAPGQFSGYVQDIDILPDSRILVSDSQRINWFDENGSFLKRQDSWNYVREMAVSPSGNILASRGYWNDYFELNNHDGDNIASINRDTVFSNFNWDTPTLPLTFIGQDAFAAYVDGAIVVFNAAYRTKGLPAPNKIPEPSIRSITQRPGTNIIDIVFEILDSDDENATVGILAAVDGHFENPQSWIAPTTLVDGSDARIGVPIATNMEHNVSWDIGQDWAEPTGNLKFKILCQDARRSSPVDLHFLQLPLPDGNLTISRSPVLDGDIRSYYRYLLGTKGSNISLDAYGNVVDNDGSVLLTPSGASTDRGRDMFIDSTGHRWASFIEVGSAREGSTAGTVESREAVNQIFPRNLPRQVNEYGFDVGSYGSNAWWVVSESTFPYISFSRNDYEHNGSSYYYLGQKVAASYPYFAAAGAEDWQNRQVYLHIENDSLDDQLPDPILVEPSDKDKSSSEHFGSSFAITEDWMVVGARSADFSRLYENENGNSWDEWYHDAGSVYLFDLSSGTPVEKGRFDCNQSNTYLGNSIDAFGEFVIVGAREQHQGESNWGQGGAYLLKIEADGNLTELAHLIADDGQQYDYFGDQVAISENLIAISAPWARTTTPNGETRNDGGKVYVFSYDDAGNVELIQAIQNESNEWYNHFGISIDLDGNSLAVRTNNDWQSNINLYNLNDQMEVELTSEIARPVEFDVQYFGQDISFDGGNLAISSVRDWSSERGIVFFYTSSGSGAFKLVHVFEPADEAERNAGFGQSISLSGDGLAIGLPNFDRTVDNQTSHNTGKVILFTREQN
jgi:hypothetical protein